MSKLNCRIGKMYFIETGKYVDGDPWIIKYYFKDAADLHRIKKASDPNYGVKISQPKYNRIYM